MKDTELVTALRQLKVNTKSIACLGCGYENKCSTKGCRLIGLAADMIDKYASATDIIKTAYEESKGADKSLLRDVIATFDPAYGNPLNLRNYIAKKQSNVHLDVSCIPLPTIPPLYPSKKRITDFERCADVEELAATLRCIDDSGYYLTEITQDASGVYTVFFRRPARE